VLGECGSPCAIVNFSHHEPHLDLKYFKLDLMSTERSSSTNGLNARWRSSYMHSLLDCGTSCIKFSLLLFLGN
jgi:hypothetical protein